MTWSAIIDTRCLTELQLDMELLRYIYKRQLTENGVPGPEVAELFLLCSLPMESSELVRLRRLEFVRGFVADGTGIVREIRCCVA